jgi:hypothetical protein
MPRRKVRRKAGPKKPHKSTPTKEKAYVDAVVKGSSESKSERVSVTNPFVGIYKQLSKNRR